MLGLLTSLLKSLARFPKLLANRREILIQLSSLGAQCILTSVGLIESVPGGIEGCPEIRMPGKHGRGFLLRLLSLFFESTQAITTVNEQLARTLEATFEFGDLCLDVSQLLLATKYAAFAIGASRYAQPVSTNPDAIRRDNRFIISERVAPGQRLTQCISTAHFSEAIPYRSRR